MVIDYKWVYGYKPIFKFENVIPMKQYAGGILWVLKDYVTAITGSCAWCGIMHQSIPENWLNCVNSSSAGKSQRPIRSFEKCARKVTFCELFLEFLRRNAMVSVVILAVMLARLLLKKLPKKYAYALWGVVGLRMIFRFDIPSLFSIFNIFVHAGNDGVLSESDRMMPAYAVLDNIVDAGQAVWEVPDAVPASASEAAANALTSLTMLQKVMIAVGILWIIGMFVLFVCGVVSYIRCKRRTRFAVKRTGNIWECDDLPSPFVLGLWNPQIYIPFHMSQGEYEYIIAHENYHIKRKDMVIKPLAFMLLAVYWINPLVWLAYVYMVRDMEIYERF